MLEISLLGCRRCALMTEQSEGIQIRSGNLVFLSKEFGTIELAKLDSWVLQL